MTTTNEDIDRLYINELQTLAKLRPGNLVDTEAFEDLTEQGQEDVLFLRESRLRDRNFHRGWSLYPSKEREWIRTLRVYDQMVVCGRWREFKGQLGKKVFDTNFYELPWYDKIWVGVPFFLLKGVNATLTWIARKIR